MPFGRGVKSTVRSSDSATRQAPWRSRGKRRALREPRVARRRLRLAAGDVEVDQGRPNSSSRTAPPTIQACSPARISGRLQASSTVRRARLGPDSIRETTVVDRLRDPRVMLGQHAVSDQRDWCVGRKLLVEPDGDRVHGHGSDHGAAGAPRRRPPFPSYRDGIRLRSRPARPRSTCPRPPRTGGHSPRSLPRAALTCASRLSPSGEPAPGPSEGYRRTASPYSAIPHRAASNRDSGMRRAAALFAAWRIRCGGPSSPLRSARPARARTRIGVRGGEMRHQSDDVPCRLRQLREPPPPHSRVELEVDADTFRHRRLPGRELEVGLPRKRDLPADRRSHDEDADARKLGAKLQPLRHRRDAEHARALVDHCSGDDRPVAVAVRLHDRPERRPSSTSSSRRAFPPESRSIVISTYASSTRGRAPSRSPAISPDRRPDAATASV